MSSVGFDQAFGLSREIFKQGWAERVVAHDIVAVIQFDVVGPLGRAVGLWSARAMLPSHVGLKDDGLFAIDAFGESKSEIESQRFRLAVHRRRFRMW